MESRVAVRGNSSFGLFGSVLSTTSIAVFTPVKFERAQITSAWLAAVLSTKGVDGVDEKVNTSEGTMESVFTEMLLEELFIRRIVSQDCVFEHGSRRKSSALLSNESPSDCALPLIVVQVVSTQGADVTTQSDDSNSPKTVGLY